MRRWTVEGERDGRFEVGKLRGWVTGNGNTVKLMVLLVDGIKSTLFHSLINQSTSQLINQSTNQQLSNQLILQSTKLPINKSTNFIVEAVLIDAEKYD